MRAKGIWRRGIILNHSKVVLITGAARRIGKSIAELLHAQGMNVVLHYHKSMALALNLCNELNRVRENSAIAIPANLSVPMELSELMKKATQAWGYLDALINNASAFFPSSLGQVNEQHWDDLLNTNLKAPFFLSQLAIPWLKQRQGTIINIVDIHANKRPLKGYLVYDISKSGLLGLTYALAKELAPEIRVNGISPGVIAWPEHENALPAVIKADILSRIALNKTGQPNDIAKAALFFIESADYITGQVLAVDGGRLLNC